MGNSAGFMRHLTPMSALGAVIALWGINYWLDIIKSRTSEQFVEEQYISDFVELSEEDLGKTQ